MTVKELEQRINGSMIRVPAGTKIGQKYVPGSTPGQQGYYIDAILEADTFIEVSVRGSLWYMITGALQAKGGVKVGGPIKVKRVTEGRVRRSRRSA